MNDPATLKSQPMPLEPGGDLPMPASSFLGRSSELEAVLNLLKRHVVPLVTLTGAGGVGKTRLALMVASAARDSFQDGVVFVPLASVRDVTLVPEAVARALGLEDFGADPLATLEAVLRERQVLLVLDNLEHLPELATLVARWLARAPGVKVLATSRAPLRISGEHEYPLSGLDLPEEDANLAQMRDSSAVQLFESRARAVLPSFEIDERNALSIVQIVRRLDGLPLVLELAAARLRLFSSEELLRRLERPLSLLAGGSRDLPARQQTIRTTIDWSFDLLGTLEQQFFIRLGVFVGGFDLESAQAVASNTKTDALEMLALLLESSLVQRLSDNRYRLLEPVREYALEKLEQLGELEVIRNRHAAYFLAFVERARPENWTEQHTAMLHEFDRELPNIRAAFSSYLKRDEGDSAALMGWCLWNFWWARGYSAEGRNAMDRALACRSISKQAQTRAHFVRYSMLYMGGDYLSLNQYASEIIEAFRSVGDRWGEAIALFGMGLVRTLAGRHDEAEEAFSDALEVFRAINDRRAEGFGLYGLGLVAFMRGDLELARERLETGKGISFAANDPGFFLSSAIVLIFIELMQGATERAEALVNESLSLALGSMERPFLADSLEVWAIMAVMRQDYARAARLFGTASVLRSAIGVPLLQAFRQHLNQAILTTQEALGSRFEVHHSEGRAMGFEAALEYARSAPEPITSEPVLERNVLTDLTPRELEVLRLLARGDTNKEIAGDLGMSPTTVHSHVRSIFSKLNVSTRTAATRLALEQGLI